MKITKSQLKKIVKEELEKVLKESWDKPGFTGGQWSTAASYADLEPDVPEDAFTLEHWKGWSKAREHLDKNEEYADEVRVFEKTNPELVGKTDTKIEKLFEKIKSGKVGYYEELALHALSGFEDERFYNLAMELTEYVEEHKDIMRREKIIPGERAI
tara:strand:- start:1313 stop:1783 length:471 start_codon:yes stop_codon:yes gene_type:complete